MTARVTAAPAEGYYMQVVIKPRSAATLAAIIILILIAPLLARPAAAQERPAPVGEFAGGALLFFDDGETVSEGLVGGTARYYLSPKVSIGPEIAFIHGNNHSHLMLTGNVTFDLISPANGQPRAITPFIVAGGGLFRTRESFRNGDFTHTEGAFTAGGGVRALVGERLLLGAEARLGWETHIRVNAIVGVRLGK